MPDLHLLGSTSWQRLDGSRLVLGGERRHQVLALLGYRADWVTRDRLATLLWPERSPGAARGNLRKVLHEVRALDIPGLDEGSAGLRWLPGSDADEFRLAFANGHWQQAAATGRGTLMPGLDADPADCGFTRWLLHERGHWHRLWREAMLNAAAASDAHQAWALAGQLLAQDASDEDAVALALRAGIALQRAEPVRELWHRHLQTLEDDRASRPSPDLLALANRALAPPAEPLSPMIGRACELQALCALFTTARLVTVSGPGGVGKTRLARDAALALAPRFAQGAVWVVLDDALTPDELPGRVAAALGLQPGTGPHGDAQALQALACNLAPRSLLLVLDGFESVIDAGPQVLRLLAAAPGLCALVTSRERLAIDGEWLLPLHGLATPAVNASAADALLSPSVALFVARARALAPAFDAPAAIGAVADICRRLEGLPLALELAASWLRMVPVDQIADELERNAGFFAHGHPHELRGMFDRSWGLLTATERDAQLRLAVFCGGFSRQAAQQVAGVGLHLLGALLDKSMLTARADGRLGMHTLLLHSLRQKLAALPEAAALRERHSQFYLALVLQPGAGLLHEQDNLLAAWQDALMRRDVAAVEAVLFTLPWWAITRGRLDEATTLLSQAAAGFGADQAAGAQLLALQAWMLLWQEERAAARALARRALGTLRAAGHTNGVVMALRTLGHAERMNGRYTRAARLLALGVALAAQAGRDDVQALMQDGLAMALNLLGRHAQARAAVRRAAALSSGAGAGAGDTAQHLYNLYNLSQSHSMAGEAAQALPWAEQALALALRMAHANFLPLARLELAQVHLALGRPDAAAEQIEQVRQTAQERGDFAALAGAHAAGAQLALLRGQAAQAWQEVSAGARLCLQRGNLVVGSALVLAAARVRAGQPDAERWLRALHSLPQAPQPLRREAGAALARLATTAARPPANRAPTGGDEGKPARLDTLLAELLAERLCIGGWDDAGSQDARLTG